MKLITDTLSKYFFILPFGVFGIMHFAYADGFAQAVPAWLPWSHFWVYFLGVCMLAATGAVLINKQAKLALFLLGVLMMVFVFTLHLPTVLGGDQMAMASVLKDFALGGAAFYFSGKSED